MPLKQFQIITHTNHNLYSAPVQRGFAVASNGLCSCRSHVLSHNCRTKTDPLKRFRFTVRLPRPFRLSPSSSCMILILDIIFSYSHRRSINVRFDNSSIFWLAFSVSHSQSLFLHLSLSPNFANTKMSLLLLLFIFLRVVPRFFLAGNVSSTKGVLSTKSWTATEVSPNRDVILISRNARLLIFNFHVFSAKRDSSQNYSSFKVCLAL